jgi:ATP-dependent helicase/nuclease subunit A
VAWSHQSLAAFQDDIRTYLNHLFDTALAAIAEFDRYKKSRGLIDYTDMEVLVSRLLDNPSVREVLRDELDLLMVDEFQDTSPIQLEIFLKLSQLAPHSVWVGDPKQSIYGFRGAEPRLMDAIVQAAGGVKPENIQTNSWRSREELVYTSNAIFCRAFGHLSEAQVALKPVRLAAGSERAPAEPLAMEHALLHWHFQVEGDRRRPPASPWMEEALARALQEWLASKVLIQPKGSTDFRHAQAGDVAILCRSNAACVKMAAALNRAGLAAAIAQAGLLQTAEVRLVLACLKYILQAEDSLSVAEIQILATRTALEEVVEDRLAYLDAHSDIPSYQRPPWAQDDPYVQQLDELRPRLAELSSAETLNLLLEELDLRRCVVPWGNSEQRLANLDQLRKLSLDYEAACNSTHTAASLGGFLLWLNKLAASEQDLQGAGEDPLAVNILTYHRSKGLEWPVVVCHNLDNRLRDELWGFELVAEENTVNLERVLADRWLRYWVNPYADQQGKTPLLEALGQSEAQTKKRQDSLAEEARLLYVGITRARDYLILPTRMNTPTKWLNRVWSQGDESIPTLDANDSETPWEWQGKVLTKDTRVFTFPEQFTVVEPSPQPAPFLPPAPTERPTHPELLLSPAEWLGDHDWKLLDRHQYYVPPTPAEGVEDEALGRLRQAYLRAAYYLPGAEAQSQLATEMAMRYELPSDFAISQLLQQAIAWRQFLDGLVSQGQLRQQLPLVHWEDGRRLSVQLDWVIEDTVTDRRVLAVDSAYAGDKPQQRSKELVDRLATAAIIWQKEHHSSIPADCLVHFPALGLIWRVGV